MYDYLRLWILGSKSTQGELNNKVEFIIRRQEYITRAGMHQGPWKGSGKTGKPSSPFCFLATPTTGSFSEVLQSAHVGTLLTGCLIPNPNFQFKKSDYVNWVEHPWFAQLCNRSRAIRVQRPFSEKMPIIMYC